MLLSVPTIGSKSTEARVIAGVKLLEFGGVGVVTGRTRTSVLLLGGLPS